MLDIKNFLDEIRQTPYEELVVRAPHTGRVRFFIKETGVQVKGAEGPWQENQGTRLVAIERERNLRLVHAPETGEIVGFFKLKDGDFVQAGDPLLTIRHFLTRKEVIDRILQQALFLCRTPEKGRFYFTPDIDIKIKTRDCTSIHVCSGMEMFILSRMKRETLLPYIGPEGIIYATYFNSGDDLELNAPLIGICPHDQLEHIEEVIGRVRNEWNEKTDTRAQDKDSFL